MIEQLSPREVADRLEGDHPPLMLDVRELWERETAAIPGSVHIPMGEIRNRAAELPSDRDIVIHCHYGGRSQKVAEHLQATGAHRVANLDGGIDRWSSEVDPTIPRYS